MVLVSKCKIHIRVQCIKRYVGNPGWSCCQSVLSRVLALSVRLIHAAPTGSYPLLYLQPLLRFRQVRMRANVSLTHNGFMFNNSDRVFSKQFLHKFHSQKYAYVCPLKPIYSWFILWTSHNISICANHILLNVRRTQLDG